MHEVNRVRIGEHVTIYRRGGRGIWTADFWDDGKHRRQSLRTTNKRVATRKALVLEHKLVGGSYQPAPPPTTISVGKQQYLSHLEAENRAAKTLVRYTGELSTFDEFCRNRGLQRLSQIAPAILDAYRAERRKTHQPKTVHHETMVIKQLLRWSESRGLIGENPLRHYRVSKPVTSPKPAPSLHEVQRILAAATVERRGMFAVLAFTGMRVGELQHLRIEDVDLKGGWFEVLSRPGAETKTKLSRRIPVHSVLAELLRKTHRPNGAFFFSAKASSKYPAGGNHIKAKCLNEDFQRIAKGLGMPTGREAGYTLHALRRFFETFCCNQNVPQRAVDVWMGHRSDKSMGAVYYSLSDADSQALMAKVPFNLEPAASAGEVTSF